MINSMKKGNVSNLCNPRAHFVLKAAVLATREYTHGMKFTKCAAKMNS